jgi:hypothetical protein
MLGDCDYPARKRLTLAVLGAITDPIDQALYFGERRSLDDRPIWLGKES